MKTRKDGTVSGKGSRRNWKPKSSGTTGEVAMATALQSAGIPFKWGAGNPILIKTRFREWPFSVDFLLECPNSKGLVVEVDGNLHYKTWKGKPAIHRMKKDEIKNECLRGEGYMVFRVRDTEIKNESDKVIDRIRCLLKLA